MNLGEKIYDLRVKKNLSQGDIADALEVSRQSVSKWENNNAVPDLDKIIKLAELFEVSLDELVLGKESVEDGAGNDNRSAENAYTTQYSMHQTASTSTAPDQPPAVGKRTAGIILLCTAALILLLCTLIGGAGGLLTGFLFALPFVISAVICFKVKNLVGLWCTWTFYFCGDLFLYFFTGIHPNHLWSELRYILLVDHGITGRMIATCVIGFIVIALVVYTIRCLVKTQGKATKTQVTLSAGILAALLLIDRLEGWYMAQNQMIVHWLINHGFVYTLYRLAAILLDWGKMWAFIALLVSIIKYCKRKKEQ